MGLFNAKNHLGNVPTCFLLLDDVFSEEEAKKVTAYHVLHNEVEIGIVLKTCKQRNDPLGLFRLGGYKEVPFRAEVAFLAIAKHVGFADDLHRVDLPRCVSWMQLNV